MSKFSLIKLSLDTLAKLSPDTSNPRKMRFEKAILSSLVAAGWSPRVDALSGVLDLPIITHDWKIVRGCGRLGTAQYAVNPENTDISADDRDAITRLVAAGEITVYQLAKDVSLNDRYEIASDDDALRRHWTPAERYHQFVGLRTAGLTIQKASLQVGYSATNMHFQRLQLLPTEVVDAWKAQYSDAKAPRLTDGQIKEIYDSHVSIGKGRTTLAEPTRAIFQGFLDGNKVQKPAMLPVSAFTQLVKDARVVNPTLADLLNVIRGYLPDESRPCTAEERGKLIADLLPKFAPIPTVSGKVAAKGKKD